MYILMGTVLSGLALLVQTSQLHPFRLLEQVQQRGGAECSMGRFPVTGLCGSEPVHAVRLQWNLPERSSEPKMNRNDVCKSKFCPVSKIETRRKKWLLWKLE